MVVKLLVLGVLGKRGWVEGPDIMLCIFSMSFDHYFN